MVEAASECRGLREVRVQVLCGMRFFLSVMVTLLGAARDVKLSSDLYQIELVGDCPERRGDGASR